MTQKLIPKIDFYLDADGNMVFTKEYHLKRGYCCQSGCLNCPYKFNDPNIPSELSSAWSDEDSNDQNDDDDFN